MRIIVAGPQDNHTFSYIKWDLIDMGHDVVTVEPQHAFMRLYKKAQEFKPDLIICSRSGQLYHDINDIKADFPDVRVVCFNTDARGSMDSYVAEFGQNLYRLFLKCDCVYGVARGEVPMMEAEGIHAKWLVQGCFPEVDAPPSRWTIGGTYETLDLPRLYDVSFLGSCDWMHDNRVELMRKLDHEFKLNLEPAHGTDASRVYYQTKVNIGHAHSPELGENSVRDFKIMGSGGFLLTRWYDGIEGMYGDDYCKCFDVYKTVDECMSKVHYWLNHDEKREEWAAASSEMVHAKHTYRHRLEVIIGDM